VIRSLLSDAIVLALGTALLFSPILVPAQTDKMYLDPSMPIDKRVDDLVSQMTLKEKIEQMVNTSPAIPRLGIPAYDWWSEGLHGIARSGYATMFPQAIGMAATWDTDLVGRISDVISTEARAKYNEAIRQDIHSMYYGLTIWSPNINIFRDPRWGRGQETYGEDPYLTSRLGVSFVEGLQGTNPDYFKTIATPKHFAVHSGPESDRHRFNVEPSPHDLWDTYLAAFRATIVEAKADSIMCAYNAIDGYPACANHELLDHILRQDWGFKGYVTSDCGAIDDFFEKTAHHTSADNATAAADGVKAGTDTSCGSTYLALGEAVKRGLVTEAEIDVSLKRLYKARFRLGMFDPVSRVPFNSIPFSEVTSSAHRSLSLEASRESMVLLKNHADILPLKPHVRTIAVIGPNAASLLALEGNYNAVPRDPILPVDGIISEFPRAKVLYAQGAPYAEGLTVPVPRTLLHPDNQSQINGLTGEYFTGATFDGKPVVTRIDKQIDFDWNAASPIAGVSQNAFAVRWTGSITPPAAGSYSFTMRLAQCYPCEDHERFSVSIDGKEVAGFASPANAESRESGTPMFNFTFPDNKPHQLRVEYIHTGRLFGAGISMDWVPQAEQLRNEAVIAAQKADVVLAFVGLSPELEGEEMPIHVEGFSGGDRTDIKLPAVQQQMLEAIAATGKPIVIILMNGSALAVNWAQEHAEAILEAWYPGEAGGQAIAETLSGKSNPGGRLPITFYQSLDQLPPFSDYSMANRTYRYFKGKPLYGFGFGLSYSTFQYSGLKLSTDHLHAKESLTVEADVKNSGVRAGDEVAQLYLTPPQTDVSPKLALDGFTRIHLAPGQTQHIHFTLDPRALSQVDVKGNRTVSPGVYKLTLGGGQPTEANDLSTEFTIEGSQELAH
jgi:beta-glucosidase